MKKRVVAMMPIKLNNERLPGKNTMLLGGKPLLCHMLDTLLQVPGIDEIHVYCSDPAVCGYLPEGVIFTRRSPDLDLPEASFTQFFDAFQREVDAEIYICAHATAPFVTRRTVENCLQAVISDEYDSAFCAEKLQDFLWKEGAPLNFNADNIPRTQDLSPIYRETSGVYVFRKEVFTKLRRRVGHHPYIPSLSLRETVDIDLPEDFHFAELLLNADI